MGRGIALSLLIYVSYPTEELVLFATRTISVTSPNPQAFCHAIQQKHEVSFLDVLGEPLPSMMHILQAEGLRLCLVEWKSLPNLLL